MKVAVVHQLLVDLVLVDLLLVVFVFVPVVGNVPGDLLEKVEDQARLVQGSNGLHNESHWSVVDYCYRNDRVD